jgi:hypothetical protein
MAQLAGLGAIALLALLVGWLLFLVLGLPYRRQDIDGVVERRAWGLPLLRMSAGQQPESEPEAEES